MSEDRCIDKWNNNAYTSISKKEMNVDVEVKIEEVEDFETDLIVLDPESNKTIKVNNNELYADHVIKQELVIGPEEFHANIIATQINYCRNNNNNSISKTKKLYQCEKCSESYKTKRSLVSHFKNVHASIKCYFCDKTFKKMSNCKRHQDYACPNNEARKKNNAILKYGSYTHRFICDYCKKSYSHKNTLIIHIKTHTGQSKRYECKICNKSYVKKHALTCHVRSVHLDVKTYSCKYCMRRFAWRYALTCHERKHHRALS